MLAGLVFLLAASAEVPEAPAASVRVLVLDFKNEGVPEQVPGLVRDVLTSHLTESTDAYVFSAEDLRRTLDVEAQKEALGCDDESCLAEIASAMGAEYIFFGTVGALGSITIVNLNLLAAEGGAGGARAVARRTVEVTALEELPRELRAATSALAAEVLPEGATRAPPAPSAGPPMPLIAGSALAGTGVLVGVAGAATAFALASVVADETPRSAGGPSIGDKRLAQGVGLGAAGAAAVGGAIALGGLAWAGMSLLQEAP